MTFSEKDKPIPNDPDLPNRINNPIPKEPKESPKLPDAPDHEPGTDESLIEPEVQDPEKQKE